MTTNTLTPAPTPRQAVAHTTSFSLPASGPFSLAAVARFLGGMLPIADRAPAGTDDVRLAFVPDGEPTDPVGVTLRASATGADGTITSSRSLSGVRRRRVVDQIARVLSLDVDGTAFAALADHDPVVGDLQRRFPGLRPVTYLSPYEAAAWFVMGNRIRMTQASTIKRRLTSELGTRVVIGGHQHHAFPGPAVLAELPAEPGGPTAGLTTRKLDYLRALAHAALDTDLLDSAAIRSRGAEASITALQALPGIGPFTAEGIVLRGAGEPDYLTLLEPRLRRAVQQAYGLADEATTEQLEAFSEAWRPYRSWVTFLLRVALGDG